MRNAKLLWAGVAMIALLSVEYGCRTATPQTSKSAQPDRKTVESTEQKNGKLGATEILKLPATAATKISDGAELIADSAAPNGKCIKLPTHGRAWAVQWFFDSRVADNVNYLVRIKLRADKESNAGSAVACGIYSVSRKVAPIHFTIDSSELGDKHYRWVNCGNIYGREVPSAYLYLGKLVESAAKNLYIAEAQFIPAGAPGYKNHVRKKPLTLSKTAPQVKVGETVVMRVPRARQVSYPDRKIKDGKTIVSLISPRSNYWSTKWHIFNHLAPGEYQIKALLKAKSVNPAGKGLRFGIYCPKIRKECFQQFIPAKDLPVGNEYRWLNVGKAKIIDDNRAYLFVTGWGDKSFNDLKLKEISCTRIK